MKKNYLSFYLSNRKEKLKNFVFTFASLIAVWLSIGSVKAQTYLSEGFESGIPATWTQEQVSGTEDWIQDTQNGDGSVSARTGNNLALFVTTNYGDATKLVTPSMDLSGATNPTLTFYYTNVNWFGDIDELRVYYKTSAGGTWTQIGANYTTEMTSWTEVSLTLPNPSANYYIAFEGTSNYARGVTLDDITVENLTCYKPTAVTTSNTTTTTADVSWIAPVVAPANGYAYYVNTTNTIPSIPTGTVAAGVTTANLTGLNPSTQYYVWIKSICGVGDSSTLSTVMSFTTACGTSNIPYLQNFESATIPNMPSCTSIENAGSGNNWTTTSNPGFGITSKALYYLYNSSNAANAWFYTNGLNLTNGQSYRLTFKYVNGSTTWPENLKVNIGTANASGSMTTLLTDIPNIKETTVKTKTVDFVVPSTGVYYIGFNCYSTANQNTLYVDDISVDLSPTCTEPTAVTTSNITTTTADVSWIAPVVAPTNGYAYYVNTTNTIPSTATGTVGAGVTTANLTGLNPSTQYYVWIKSICGVGDSSTATTSTPFATTCAAISSLPWFEGFESVVGASTTFTSGLAPQCWTAVNKVGVAKNGNSFMTPALNGTQFLAFKYGTGTNTWAFTPQFNLTAGTSYRFKVNYANYDTNPFTSLKLAFGTSASAGSMTVIGTPVTNIINTTYKDYYVDFTVPTTGSYNLGIYAEANGSPWYLSVDDVSLDLSPSCVEPTAVTTSNVTTTAATISWTAPVVAPASGYAYYVNTTNTIPAAPTGTVGAGVTTANLTGLTDATTYYVWVKGICGVGDSSTLSTVMSFTTPCVATNIPYLEDFESATIPNMPMCTSIENAGSGNNWATNNTSSALLPTNVLRYRYNSNSAANAWFYTRGLNLTAGTSYRLKFDYTNEDDYYMEKMRVAIGQSATNASMTTQLLDFPSISTLNLEQGLIDFTVPTSGVYYIGFNAYSDADEYYLYVDNISVDLSPSCIEPNNVTTNATSSTTGTVKWNQSLSNPTNGYQYYVNTSNTAPANTTSPTGTTVSGDTTVNLTGLTANTTYYVWVRSMCSSSDTSAWTNVSSFFTGYCIPVATVQDTYIDSVYTTGGITNIQKYGTGPETNGYADFSSTDSLVVMVGDSVTMNFYLESSYGAGVALYIDTNNNMIFDANELIETSGGYLNSGSYYIGINTTNYPIGTFRARVIADAWNTNPEACSIDSDDEGEAEDYKIVIVPQCTPPTVSLGPDTTICVGSTVTLDAGNPGLAYTWSTNAHTQTINVTTAGNYIVTVKDGVCETSDTIKVTVTPKPTVSIAASKLIACPNDTITLTATGATTYTWDNNSTNAVRTVNPTANTSYSVTGTKNNCSASATVSIVIKTTGCDTGVEDLEATNVSVYPNPASMNVQIVGEELMQYYQSMTVVDLTGRTVIEMPIRSNEESINVSNLVNGIYFVNLQGKQTKTVKIEVKH